MAMTGKAWEGLYIQESCGRAKTIFEAITLHGLKVKNVCNKSWLGGFCKCWACSPKLLLGFSNYKTFLFIRFICCVVELLQGEK